MAFKWKLPIKNLGKSGKLITYPYTKELYQREIKEIKMTPRSEQK